MRKIVITAENIPSLSLSLELLNEIQKHKNQIDQSQQKIHTSSSIKEEDKLPRIADRLPKRLIEEEISEELWSIIEKLIPSCSARNPSRTYVRGPGGGRKPVSLRLVFQGIVYVLRHGGPWKKLPPEFPCSASTIHQYYLDWCEAGFFSELWRRGWAEHPDLEGINWRCLRQEVIDSNKRLVTRLKWVPITSPYRSQKRKQFVQK